MKSKSQQKKIQILCDILRGTPKSMQEVIREAGIRGINDTTTRSYLYKYENTFLEITNDKWILVEDMRNSPLPNDIIDDIIKNKKQNRNTKITQHRIVQSILIQVGKERGYQTYIPSQDKEYLFSKDQKLGDIVDTFNLPENINTPNIRTVDVIWFDAEWKVYALFEVEHTDIKKIKTKLDNYKTLLQQTEMFFLVANITNKKFIELINDKEYRVLKEKIIFISIDGILEFFKHFNKMKESNCLKILVC